MYNIDLYTYQEKPFSREKDYTIHPLDQPGKEKYYSDQSHCRHFLKRTDPFVFKSIVGLDYDSLVSQQKEDVNAFRELTKTIPSESANLKTNSGINLITEPYERSRHVSVPLEEVKSWKNSDYPNINTRYINTECNEYNKNLKDKVYYKTQSNFKPYIRKKNFKETYGYENKSQFKKKAEIYTNIINIMKKTNLPNVNQFKLKRSYDGFTCSDVPEIKRKKGNSESFNYLNNKMEQTLNCLKGINTKKAMNEEELKQNLFNQTSEAFRKKYHLPDLMKIADTKQLIKKQRIGLSKEMGERYNPYSLIAPSKNRTGRNYVGDLFKH